MLICYNIMQFFICTSVFTYNVWISYFTHKVYFKEHQNKVCYFYIFFLDRAYIKGIEINSYSKCTHSTYKCYRCACIYNFKNPIRRDNYIIFQYANKQGYGSCCSPKKHFQVINKPEQKQVT